MLTYTVDIQFTFLSLKLKDVNVFMLSLFVMQEPLGEEEIEELIAEFLEVESKVLYFCVDFSNLYKFRFLI